jgi:hypothetical protein
MALSTEAHALLDALKPGGGPSNLGSLKARLNLGDEDFSGAQEELIEAGLATLQGKGRLARVNVGNGELSVEAAMLLAGLPNDGSTVGNYSVRGQLALDDDTYAEAKRELRGAGLIKVGVGYGGTIGRAAATADPTATEKPLAAGLVALERELYEPFAKWLRSSLEDQGLFFAEARVTGPPRGYKRKSGKWSRPDVTAVQVSRYDWLPDITVEVSTYEIKQAGDAKNLDIVYETAAHGRWAHRASLVVEQSGDSGPVPSDIFDEVRRFRLGLYAMRRRADGEFDVREIIKPPLTHESQPEYMNELLGYFLGDDNMIRQNYRKAIGQ